MGADLAETHRKAVLRLYDAYNTGDTSILEECVDEDVVAHSQGEAWWSGDHFGREHMVDGITKLHNLSDGTWRVELIDVLANDRHAVGYHMHIATRGDKRVETPLIVFFIMKDGKIAEFWEHPFYLRDITEFWDAPGMTIASRPRH